MKPRKRICLPRQSPKNDAERELQQRIEALQAELEKQRLEKSKRAAAVAGQVADANLSIEETHETDV